jgi:threonine aldolase
VPHGSQGCAPFAFAFALEFAFALAIFLPMEMINLISDTVTRPTSGMLDAMMSAEVGDDVFRQDPTVNALEEKAAKLFGHEAALFCPSGTMTNQIALKVLTQPLDEVICDITSHIYLYELGGYGFNSGVHINVLNGKDGKLNVEQVEEAIKPDRDWLPTTRVVSVENSCNRAGGTYYTLDDILPIKALCLEKGISMHLDGARIFNVLVETGETAQAYGAIFDTVSICLSKGLGAPVGSLLCSSMERIKHARKVRKVLGGGMRQAGYLAAAGIYALDNNIERLRIDNTRAKEITALLQSQPYVKEILPGGTNIIIFRVTDQWTVEAFSRKLEELGVLAAPMSRDTIRFVFHLDITEEMMAKLKEVLLKIHN